MVRTLRTALSSGRLAHAYLFSGPRGSGKTSAAKIMARCVNCVAGPTPDPDNTCEHCLAMLAGTALDVLEIDAASNRGIEAIRELRDAVRFAPAQMRMKVYILDEAHAITSEGANAFLKTLEEPPPHALFILATTEPDKLPQTVLSRCQRYAFRRIPVETMIARMRVIAVSEGIGIADEALAAIAYRADGGLRDALTMLEQVAAFAGAGGGTGVVVGPEAVDAAFGASGRNYARGLVAAANAGDAASALTIIDDASEAGTDMQLLLQGTLEGYRNLLVARLNPSLLSRDLAAPDAEAAIAAAAATPQAQIVRGLRILGDAYAAARRTSARLELETAVLRLVLSAEEDAPHTKPAVAVTPARPSPASRPDAAARVAPARPPSSPIFEPAAPAAAAEPASAPTLQQVRGAWQNIRTRVQAERPPLQAVLARAVVSAVDAATVTLTLGESAPAEILRSNAAVMERAIAEVLGVPLALRVAVERGTQARSAHRGDPSGARPEPDAAADPDLALLDYATERIGRRTT